MKFNKGSQNFMPLQTELETITLTTSQAILLYLSKQKVELFDGRFAPLVGGFWGIFGHGNVAGLGEAISNSEIPYFRGQNEQGMAHAAIAFAKASRCRRVMGVTTSIGPGATNLVTAAALAHINRLPVLFLPGDVYASRRPDPVLQQLENWQNPTQSVNDCFIPVSRFFDRITSPEQLLHSLPRVVSTLLDRGPVTLCLPQDVQVETFDFPKNFFAEKCHYIQRLNPDERQAQRFAEKLKKAKRPLIIAGGGVHYSFAEETLRAFVERHGIPMTETQAGKGSLSWEHPLNLGAIGVTGNAAANAIAKEADCILAVGTRLSDFTTASKSLYHRDGVSILGLNISSFDAEKGANETLIADVKTGLQSLSSLLKAWSTDVDYKRLTSEQKCAWEKLTPCEESANVSDTEVIYALNQFVEDKDIVVCAAGGLPGELHKHWRTRDPLSYHAEYGYSCMGYEIAGGLGVKLAHPDREVYILCGDGSYLMLHTELFTAIQLRQKIHVILFDNRGFGCINRLQKGCNREPFGNLFPEGSPRVDFVVNARSYGCYANKVRSLQEFRNELGKCRSKQQTCVTVLETDPERSSASYASWEVPF